MSSITSYPAPNAIDQGHLNQKHTSVDNNRFSIVIKPSELPQRLSGSMETFQEHTNPLFEMKNNKLKMASEKEIKGYKKTFLKEIIPFYLCDYLVSYMCGMAYSEIRPTLDRGDALSSSLRANPLPIATCITLIRELYVLGNLADKLVEYFKASESSQNSEVFSNIRNFLDCSENAAKQGEELQQKPAGRSVGQKAEKAFLKFYNCFKHFSSCIEGETTHEAKQTLEDLKNKALAASNSYDDMIKQLRELLQKLRGKTCSGPGRKEVCLDKSLIAVCFFLGKVEDSKQDLDKSIKSITQFQNDQAQASQGASAAESAPQKQFWIEKFDGWSELVRALTKEIREQAEKIDGDFKRWFKTLDNNEEYKRYKSEEDFIHEPNKLFFIRADQAPNVRVAAKLIIYSLFAESLQEEKLSLGRPMPLETQIQLINLLWHPHVLEPFFLIVLSLLYVENIDKREKIGTQGQIETAQSALATLSGKTELTQADSEPLIKYLEEIKSYEGPFKKSLKQAKLPNRLPGEFSKIATYLLKLKMQEKILWETVESIISAINLAYEGYQDIYNRFEKQKKNLSERQQHMRQNTGVDEASAGAGVKQEEKTPPEDQTEAIEQEFKAMTLNEVKETSPNDQKALQTKEAGSNSQEKTKKEARDSLETLRTWFSKNGILEIPKTDELEDTYELIRGFLIDNDGSVIEDERIAAFTETLVASKKKGEDAGILRNIRKPFKDAPDFQTFLENAVDKPEDFQKFYEAIESLPKNSKRKGK